MQSSSKRYMYLNCGNCKKINRRNFNHKLNNFQLFKKNDSNERTSIKKDLVILYDLSSNITYENDHKSKIKIYCNGKIYQKINKKKKAINSKHFSYERYLEKKKGLVINNSITKNKKKYNENNKSNNIKNKLHNPCSWEPETYMKNINYNTPKKDVKFSSTVKNYPLPNGPAGAKSC